MWGSKSGKGHLNVTAFGSGLIAVVVIIIDFYNEGRESWGLD